MKSGREGTRRTFAYRTGKLYVTNSGGLDSEGIGVDRTVSIIDLATFREIKRLEVGPNPVLSSPAPTIRSGWLRGANR